MMLATLIATTCITIPQPPCGSHAMAPAMAKTDSGAALTWLEPATATSEDVWRLRFSRYKAADNTWSAPKTITQRRNFFVNWADTPQIAVASDGSLVSTWLQKSGGDTYAYDIGVAKSIDDGDTWTMLGALNDDRVQGEHGFVSMVAEQDGIRAVWLDGRHMTSDGHGHEGGGDMSLRTAMITDSIGPSTQLDDRTCECCPTALAIVPKGVLAAYRDRDANERRDISVVRLDAGQWATPKDLHRDDWEISGCPVNGPALDAVGERVVVAWYTGGEPAGVFAATSTDGGTTFGPPRALGTDDAIGRVAVAWRDDTLADVIWIDSGTEAATIQHAVIGGSQTHEASTIATVALGRRSGFPRMTSLGDGRMLVVWTALEPKQGLGATMVRPSTP
jgi:hypothetical protein